MGGRAAVSAPRGSERVFENLWGVGDAPSLQGKGTWYLDSARVMGCAVRVFGHVGKEVGGLDRWYAVSHDEESG